jgi:hypothetical protein
MLGAVGQSAVGRIAATVLVRAVPVTLRQSDARQGMHPSSVWRD